MKITIVFDFDQIYLGKTTGIHEWECPYMSGKNQTIDQMIDELIIRIINIWPCAEAYSCMYV